MASRLSKTGNIPTDAVALEGNLTSMRVTKLPERFIKADELVILNHINSLLLNLNAVKQDLQDLRVATYITRSDAQKLIIMSDAELGTLNQLLAGSILQKLEQLEQRIAALENTP